MLYHQKTRNTVKNITWSELNHPSLSKRSTGCTRQDLGREHSILLSVTHMLCVIQVCQGCQSLYERWELFFVKPGEKVNGQYEWDILLSQQMLDAIKHITDDNFFSFRKTAHRYVVRVTQSNFVKNVIFVFPRFAS